MKSLSQIRELFVNARNLAKEASPANAKDAADMLGEISRHCKELYESTDSYLERAKCRNIFESVDNVIDIMSRRGFVDPTVAAFFGLSGNVKGPSFADISRGEGTVLRAAVSNPTSEREEPAGGEGGDNTVSTGSDRGEIKALPLREGKSSGSVPVSGISVKSAPKNDLGSEAAPDGEDDGEADKTDCTPDVPRAADASLEVSSLADFIGQTETVRAIMDEITAARSLGVKHLDNIMLRGNRGLGKSTLMRLIAKELGFAYHYADGSSFANNNKAEIEFHNMFLRIIEDDKPCVIGIDEIHALPLKLQTRLLTLLESRCYSYIADGITRTVPIKDFTFIGATTDYDAVLQTVKDRCTYLTFDLVDYTRDEMCRITRGKLDAVGLSASDTAINLCVNRCRSSIRDITGIVKGLRTMAVIRSTSVVTREMVEEFFKKRGKDSIGLTDKDLEILRAIDEEPRGSISEETLAARVYLDPKILTKEYEPYLMRIGFISVNSRGRSLTQKARDYIKCGYFDFGDGVTVGVPPVGIEGADAPGEPPLPPTDAAEPTDAELPMPADPPTPDAAGQTND